MRAALVHKTTGVVENLIELPDDYNAGAPGAYSPSDQHNLVVNAPSDAVIGGTHSGGVWQVPDAPEPPPSITIEERIAALEVELQSLKDQIEAEA